MYAAPPAAPTVSPAASGGMPRTPGIIVRVRLLLVVLSILTAVSVALLFYVSQVEYGADTTDESTAAVSFVAFAAAFLIFATPLSLIPVLLSVFIGRGRNWARISAVVLLLTQAVSCSCLGAFLPFLPASTAPDATGEKSLAGNIGLGVLGIAIAVVSVVASVMLLKSDSRAYFRSMAMWRAASAPAARGPVTPWAGPPA